MAIDLSETRTRILMSVATLAGSVVASAMCGPAAPPWLIGSIAIIASVASNIVSSDVHGMAQVGGSTNHDLRKLLGAAIRRVISEVADRNSGLTKNDCRRLSRLATRVEQSWNLMEPASVVVEPVLVDDVVKAISDRSASGGIGRDSWSALLLSLNDKEAEPPSGTAIAAAAEALENRLADTATDLLKRDFQGRGRAYAALQIFWMSEVARRLNEREGVAPLKAPLTELEPPDPQRLAQDPPAASPSPLHLTILEGRSDDRCSRAFDLILRNATTSRIVLTKAELVWQYQPGTATALSQGVPLVPVAKYVFTMSVDPSDPSEQKEAAALYPMVVLPSKGPDGDSFTALRIQLHYTLVGAGAEHTGSDWDIRFSLDLYDDANRRLPVFWNRTWKSHLPQHA